MPTNTKEESLTYDSQKRDFHVCFLVNWLRYLMSNNLEELSCFIHMCLLYTDISNNQESILPRMNWIPQFHNHSQSLPRFVWELACIYHPPTHPPLPQHTQIQIYIYIFFFFLLSHCSPTRVMVSSFLRFLDHTQRRTTVGRTPLDEWSARRRDLCLTTHNTHNRQTSMPPVGFEPTISASERPQTYALDRAATGTGKYIYIYIYIYVLKWSQC